jgi:hypothetical protein
MERIVLGTTQFGSPYGVVNETGRVCQGDVTAILALARCAGLVTLDTAIADGDRATLRKSA